MLGATLLLAMLPQETSAPQSNGADQTTVMIVDLPRGARFAGFPKRCPGDTAEIPEEDSICLAELYQGQAFASRHLAGPRLRGRTRLRMTAHARRWPAGTRLLVATVPFDDAGTRGNFAYWWQLPERDGGFCLEAATIEKMEGALRRVFTAGRKRHFKAEGYIEATDFRCVYG